MVTRKRISNEASGGLSHVHAVALGMRWPHLVITRETLRARGAVFYAFQFVGFDVVFVAGRLAFFHHSRNHTD